MNTKCLNCGKEIINDGGKKPKKYCDGNCRQKSFQKKRNEELGLLRELTKKTYKPNKDEKKHPLYNEKDPIEGTNGFYLKFGVFTYDELSQSK